MTADHDPATCPICQRSLREDGEHLHGDLIVTYEPHPDVSTPTLRWPFEIEVYA